MNKIEELEATLKTVAEQLEKLKRGEISLHKRWRAEVGENYYIISCFNGISKETEVDSIVDAYRYNLGNYHQTREITKKELNKQLALVRVQDKLAEGGEVNWNDPKQAKWIVYYDTELDAFGSSLYYTVLFNAPLVTMNKQLAKEVIEKMKDDLKLIFEVE